MKKKLFIMMAVTLSSLITGFSGEHWHQFLWANIHTFGNNDQQALSRYQKIVPQSIWTYYGYIPFLFKNNQHQTIVDHASIIDTHFGHNASLNYMLALSLKMVGEAELCNQRMLKLNEKYPDHSEIALHAARVHIDANNREKALAVIEQYLNKSAHHTNAFLFHFLKAQIHNQMNDIPSALHNIDLCLAQKPQYSNAWLIKGSLAEKQGALDQAIECYSRFINLSGNLHTVIRDHVTKLMLAQSEQKNEKNNITKKQKKYKEQSPSRESKESHTKTDKKAHNKKRICTKKSVLPQKKT